MNKIINFIQGNLLFLISLFLIAFIPLYPKLPLIDIQHTWVYVRIEDFLIAAAYLIWFFYLLKKKITFKSPLTIPIILFWSVGAISLLYAVLLIFPTLANIDNKVALLNYLRRIEYLGLFFVAFSSIKEKSVANILVLIITLTMVSVCVYGIGQRVLPAHFPAFSTMNEEFAKGNPLQLSSKARIQSTFAGHYDLAAYLVLMISVMGSMIFGYKKWFLKIGFLAVAVMGLIVLLMTASRVSFAVYLSSIVFMLFLQKQKKLIIPVIIASILLLNSFQGISQRFSSTISQVDLVVDARTGKAIGIAKTVEPEPQSKNTTVKKPIVIEDIQSTGENLPQGSSYIIPQSSQKDEKTITTVQRTKLNSDTRVKETTNLAGDFVIKKALAYDVSFTTRFQGEWPRAIEALRRNVFLGSGYSSISLATDNNYLRILGEVGFVGLLSYVLIFLIFSIYIYKVLPQITSPVVRSLALGVSAGLFGLFLNAIFIDVFEASKVAYTMWLLMGVTIGLVHLYQKENINYVKELKNVLSSSFALCVYFLFATISIFSAIVSNYFVANDFTLARTVAECKKILVSAGNYDCPTFGKTILSFFTDFSKDVYQPATKFYFYTMYTLTQLNQFGYHLVSILVHFSVACVFYFLLRKIVGNKLFSFIGASIFLMLNVYAVTILSIALTGFMFATLFALLSFLLFINSLDSKKFLVLTLSIVSFLIAILFNESAFITLVFFILYIAFYKLKEKLFVYFIPFIVIFFLYYFLRFSVAKSQLFLNLNFMKGIETYNYNVISILISIAVLIGAYFLRKKKIAEKTIVNTIFFSGSSFLLVNIVCLIVKPLASEYNYINIFPVILSVTCIFYNLYLKSQKKFSKIFILLTVIVVILFEMYQVKYFYKINADWTQAGVITNRTQNSFDETFIKNLPQNPVFYFVNVPKYHGVAPVFVTGLADAMWFTFQNQNVTVKEIPNVEVGLQVVEASSSARIFEFLNNYSLEEISLTKTVIPQKK